MPSTLFTLRERGREWRRVYTTRCVHTYVDNESVYTWVAVVVRQNCELRKSYNVYNSYSRLYDRVCTVEKKCFAIHRVICNTRVAEATTRKLSTASKPPRRGGWFSINHVRVGKENKTQTIKLDFSLILFLSTTTTINPTPPQNIPLLFNCQHSVFVGNTQNKSPTYSSKLSVRYLFIFILNVNVVEDIEV